MERDIKEVSYVVLTGDAGTNLEDQMGDEDDDLLVEECEFMMADNITEDQVGEEAGIAGQQMVNKAKKPKVIFIILHLGKRV